MTPPILDATVDELRRDRTSVKWRSTPPTCSPSGWPRWTPPPAPPSSAPSAPPSSAGTPATPGRCRMPLGSPTSPARAGAGRLDPETAVAVTDVLTGIGHLLRLLTDEAGPVVVSPPVYNAFYDLIASVGRRVVEAPLTTDGRIDPETLADAFRSATADGGRAAYLLCNPHNPTGTVPTADELATVARLAREHGVRVVSDEIHAPLVLGDVTFTPYLTVPGAGGGAHGHLGFQGVEPRRPQGGARRPGPRRRRRRAGAAPARDLRREPPRGGRAAGRLGGRARVARRPARRARGQPVAARALVDGAPARRPPAPCPTRPTSPGSTVATSGWATDRARSSSTAGRVALSDGQTFGAAGAGYVRVNFATSPEVLRDAVARMASCVA